MKMKRTTESKRLTRLVISNFPKINIKHNCVEGYVVIKRFRQYEDSDESYSYEEYDAEFHGQFRLGNHLSWLNVKEFTSKYSRKTNSHNYRFLRETIRRETYREVSRFMKYFSIKCDNFRTKIKKITWV